MTDEPRRERYCHILYDVAGNIVMTSLYSNIPESEIARLEAEPPVPLTWREDWARKAQEHIDRLIAELTAEDAAKRTEIP